MSGVMPTLPADLAANPRLSQWVSIAADNTIELRLGKVELGQGVITALAQMAAEELEVSLDRLRIVAGATGTSPNQGFTVGSLSIQFGGTALRAACAEVRQRFIDQASRRLNVAADQIVLEGGVFSTSSKPQMSLTYADLAEDVDLEREADGLAQPKSWQARALSGSSALRLDFNAKLFGAGFIQDFELPGMVHGRVARPPSYGASLLEFDPEPIRRLAGVVHVLVDGSFVGVCAEREEQVLIALKAIQRAARWRETAQLPAPDETQSWLQALTAQTNLVEQAKPGSAASESLRLDLRYSKPFVAHASIGPACSLATWQDGHLTVWSHTQGSFALRHELAMLFKLDDAQVSVNHKDGAGCYGHNSADDAAFDAALLARASGRPVRIQWSREDELSWAPFGSAMVVNIEAALDASGRIVDWRHQSWSHSHAQRPGGDNGASLMGAWHCDPPWPMPTPRDFPQALGGGGQRNAQPLYELPSREIVYHFVPDRTLRTSALRTLGAYANIFALESCMDELALAAGQDPIAFRLNHLQDPRARVVLEQVAEHSGWHQDKPEATNLDAMRGRGIGFARYKNSAAYCAVVIEIEVSDRIVMEKVTVVVDAGEVINPDGLINQVEGGLLQAASWTLKEAVQWDDGRIVSNTWDTYPILSFADVPSDFTVHVIPHPDLPPLGVGECAAGPTAAALSNALADALGLRMRDLPLTPERLMAAMQAA